MYERHTHGAPERKFTTGLPVGIIFLSMVVITAYLLIGGALSDSGGSIATVLPKPPVLATSQ